MEEALECAFDNLPGALGQLLKFALLVFAISGALALIGVGVVAFGAARLRRRSSPGGPGGELEGADPAWVGLALVGGGAALVVPAAWLLLALAVAVLT